METIEKSNIKFSYKPNKENELNDEEDCVTLSQAEVMTLHSHTEGSEVALKILEEVCGISLQSN